MALLKISASGFEKLVTGVREYLESFEVTANVLVGARELAKQSNQGQAGANRIVLVPFDPKSGDGGDIGQPLYAGERDIMSVDDPEVRVGTVRAIGEWRRNLLVSVWAHDATKPRDELAQEVALEQLVEWTKRAIDATGGNDVEWGRATFMVPTEHQFGLEVRIGFAWSHPLYDVPQEVGYPGLNITRKDGEE